MIYATGDCHADWSRFVPQRFPEQEEMTRDDFVIICGDFGLWHDNNEEQWWFRWLNSKPFTILFVDGNHENFDRLYSDEFPVVDFHGGKAHKIRDNIYHLMRGYIYDIDGKKFFAFGGASSHDISDGILDRKDFKNDAEFIDEIRLWNLQRKSYRVNHLSWWEQELPSQEEMDFGLKTLEENGNKVDYIITHCCPQSLAEEFSKGFYKEDRLTEYFDKVAKTVDFSKWFFGHYHNNRELSNKYTMLYEEIVRVV